MSTRSAVSAETIECPLCLGAGRLKRSEVLDRLGVKDFARVAQLSAEEAFRLLQHKQDHDREGAWARFETELTKRTAEIKQHHRDELHSLGERLKEFESAARVADQQKALDLQRLRTELEGKLRLEQSQKDDLSRRVEDYLREVGELRERNQELETEMSKVARIGKREEMDFAEEARAWPGVAVSDKLPKNGDFILSYRDPSGAALEPRMLVDNKDKAAVAESDIDKLVRDARERSMPVAVLVTRTEEQLRQVDKESRWARKDGVWILRTTRQWLPRDLDVLKPLFERMRVQGLDFLDKNAALAEEVRRTFADLDRVGSELKKAARAIGSASGLVTKYRGRLQELCDNAPAGKIPPTSERLAANLSQ